MPETPPLLESQLQSHDAEALDALRALGADRRDPVRFRLAESLARRASGHAGAARRVLDARLAALIALMAPLAGSSDQAPANERAPSTHGPRVPRGPLGALVDHVARQKAVPVLTVAPQTRGQAADPAAAAQAPPALHFFKRTWSRLSADQRLAQSRDALPENAGPLNSQHLVHRSLTLMRELSPEYLEHFVGYIDALQWVERANEAAAQEAATTRSIGARRSLPARR